MYGLKHSSGISQFGPCIHNLQLANSSPLMEHLPGSLFRDSVSNTLQALISSACLFCSPQMASNQLKFSQQIMLPRLFDPLVAGELHMRLQCVFLISFKHFSGISKLSSSNSVFMSTSQSGVCIHNLQLADSAGVIPLMEHLPGSPFLDVVSNTQQALISLTQDGFHYLVVPFIQYSTILELVKQ